MSDETIHAQFTVLNGVYRNHDDLLNRDLADQHPIGAITGLQDALDSKTSEVEAEEARAKGVEGSLTDLTTDSKTNLVSAINEVDSHADTNATNLSNHIANKTNPHEVTKAQVGLGNVDNTSDLNKPISTAVQSALNGKQDNLTTAQLTAVNSGINSTLVGQISTNESNITNLSTDKADKSTTYTKTEVDTALSGKADKATTLAGYGITDGANVSLSNLNADGQMIVDSVNGTISNCILEIPQNIHLTLENNILTLKAGSVITKTGSTYATSTLTSDISITVSDTLTDGRYLIFVSTSSIGYPININKIGSGSSLPTDGNTYSNFFNTTDKLNYYWTGTEWNLAGSYYPICVIQMNNGVVSFAKDSNGNDMIFNGMGFVGQHRFVYPNVKCLFAAGKDSNGKLLSNIVITNGLLISGNTTQKRTVFCLHTATSANAVDPNAYYYSEAENLWRRNSNNNVLSICVLANTSGNVDSMTIRQPYQGARNMLMDDIKNQVKQNTTDISTKQVDITTIIGYDATKTQTLKNVNGVLTWINEGV